jgi:hypothetical protein
MPAGADLTVAGGGQPAFQQYIATVFDPYDNVVRINYLAGDGHVHELSLDARGWHDADLTALVGMARFHRRVHHACL